MTLTRATALLAIVVIVLFFFVLAPWWAVRKSREFKNRRASSRADEFFFRPLRPNWYVSVQFCLGLALAAWLAVVLFRLLA